MGLPESRSCPPARLKVAAFVQILVPPSPTKPPAAPFPRPRFSIFEGVIKKITSCPDAASEVVVGAPVEVAAVARNGLLDSSANVVEKSRSIPAAIDSVIGSKVDGDIEVDRFVKNVGNIPRWVDGNTGAVGKTGSTVAASTGTR
jgi:hypothetical protein